MVYYITDFFSKNWSNLLLALVGLSAVWIYKTQEKEKIKDAAAIIVLQIDELQKRIREIQSYITNKGLNLSAFYESLPLMDINYWNKYKHIFIRKIDNKSYDNFNKFYQYVSCIQEQQELMRNLQKNYFFVKQNAISNVEFSFIIETLKEVDNSIISPEQLQNLMSSFPKSDDNSNNEQTIYNMILQLQQRNPNIDMERFWGIYQNKRERFIKITNSDSLTPYTPTQISETIQTTLDQYSLLNIDGLDGYRKLRELAQIDKK